MLFNSLSFIAGTLYIIVGIFVIVTKTFSVKLSPTTANVLGAILCAYGAFRIVRAFIQLKKRKDEQ